MIRRIRNSIANLFRLPRRLPQLIRQTDNILLLLAGLALALFVGMVLIPILIPTLTPFIPIAPKCNSLAAPAGGNSRSMLSLDGDSFQELGLDLVLQDKSIRQGEELTANIILTNKDRGAVILFMPPNEDLIQNSPAVQGVQIEIRNLVTNQLLSYRIPAASIPQSTTYRQAEIHLLRSHQRCQQSYRLDVSALPPGEYTIIARYANTQAGVRSVVAGEVPNPALPSQGVWAANVPVESQELRFSIQPPPTPTLFPQ